MTLPTEPRKSPVVTPDAPDAGIPGNAVPRQAGTILRPDGERMGDMLIRAGRLTPREVDRILQKQENDRMRFGDAAIALGLLSEDEVQQLLSRQYQYPDGSSIPALAEFPIVSAPHGSEAEAVRKLRTQIVLKLDTSRTQALAIISPNAGEGKSYVAASLALAFAQNGRRTLLINANLREPQISGLLDTKRQRGLSSVLAGRHMLSDSLEPTGFPHLSVLDAGPLPPNPAELLLPPKLSDVIRKVQADFDIILLDTPPANPYPDAQLIAQQVDGCILVARGHHTYLGDIQRTKQLLLAAGGTLLGSVYNGHPARLSSDRCTRTESGVMKRWWQSLRQAWS